MLMQADLKAGSIVECNVLNKTYRLLVLKDARPMDKDSSSFIMPVMWMTPDFGEKTPRYVLNPHPYPSVTWTKLC